MRHFNALLIGHNLKLKIAHILVFRLTKAFKIRTN